MLWHPVGSTALGSSARAGILVVANPIEDLGRCPDVVVAGQTWEQPHQPAHGADPATAVDASLRMPIHTVTGAAAEIIFDVVRNMVLNPLVVIAAVERSHMAAFVAASGDVEHISDLLPCETVAVGSAFVEHNRFRGSPVYTDMTTTGNAGPAGEVVAGRLAEKGRRSR